MRSYGARTPKLQVNEALSREDISDVSATYKGMYEWTVNIGVAEDHLTLDKSLRVPDGLQAPGMQFKFGPTAWYANERDPDWKKKVT